VQRVYDISAVCEFAVDSSYTLLLEAECCRLLVWIYLLLLLLLLNKSLRLVLPECSTLHLINIQPLRFYSVELTYETCECKFLK
jgi:hypothetical protein